MSKRDQANKYVESFMSQNAVNVIAQGQCAASKK